ncbi:hypothetical protein INT47_005178 [Mucor saturninus]|uniref:CBM21 domain-containing protein n=1 Tax=Mucor saturninus TaxID=64648 RepID=A0A8H7QVT8_9FUNG|nr:hypothetical protein INT47_005178 [Mucor saturninus]
MMTDMQHRRVALIKRPPLVRSSSPATCYQSQSRKPKKSVRFCDSLESVRLFLKTDEPQACQSDPSSPVVYTYGLRLPNWPSSVDVNTPAVRMEGVSLVDHVLNGTCTVANLAFEKHVSLHYSLDDWVTVQQVNAVYKEPIAHSAHTWDRFGFKIVLDACHETTTIYLAVKYAVAGRIFWDNNHGNNYTAKIIPKAQLNDEDSCCSSSDSDEEEEEEEEEQMKHAISLPSIVKPLLSPPLSPTTPVDMNPLWSIRHPHQHQHSVKPIHYIHSL